MGAADDPRAGLSVAEAHRLDLLALDREVEHVRRTLGPKAAERTRRVLGRALEDRRRELVQRRLEEGQPPR
ncbi:hypothetical protein GCM10027596_15690 [Nocardioides korecus]